MKHKVTVKVTKFCVGREELINVYKITKFDCRIINGLWGTKLNINSWHRTDRKMVFRKFIEWTCFAIRSINWLLIHVKLCYNQISVNSYMYYAPGLKGLPGDLVIGSSVHTSVRNSFCLHIKCNVLRLGCHKVTKLGLSVHLRVARTPLKSYAPGDGHGQNVGL